MPELPEVEMVRRCVEADCAGRAIVKARVLDKDILDWPSPEAFVKLVEGRQVIGALRHGKQLFLDLGDGLMTVHLGMTGDLCLLTKREKLPPHARAVLTLDDGRRLVYDDPRKFGSIGHALSVQDFVAKRSLGPDALVVRKREFLIRASRSHRAIKTVLLDQHVIAGVGNLYADEALFQTWVHPLQPADTLPGETLERMCRKVRKVLQASIDVATDPQRLPDGFLLRSRVEGEACPRGNGELMTVKVGGRTSYYCPGCQVIF